MKPGDTVSLIVRGRNPLDSQKFVDVGSLLMELQKVPPASDGSYHVFLAPPDFPQPVGGQKFDVTYVGAPPREQQKDPRNPHPPLFVAPLDYSVPQGYGRVQIPTQHVKFALNGGINSFQQPAQFQQPQQIRQPQQFQPLPPPPPQRPQFQSAPQPQQVQFQPPQPAQFLPPPPQPQFQPIPSQQPQQFQPPQRPQFQQPPPPSIFEQSLSDVRIQTGFVPVQALEETAPPPPPPAHREPLVLAVESPEFLRLDTPLPPPPAAPVPEAPSTTPKSVTTAQVIEEKVVPVAQQLPVSAPQVAASVTIAPPVEDASVPAPTAAFEQTIPAATPIPAPEVSEQATTRPSNKKRPVNRIPIEGGVPQWPDFQSVRQRQQLQRQQQNRKKTSGSSGNTFESSSAVDQQPQEPSFGQKIRKVKTNALVSPPLPEEQPAVVPEPQAFLVEPPPQSFEIDPPVVERDETFQTLESQNAASGNQRGRIRFNRPNDVNGIPAEATTAPPVRQTISTQVGGRGRVRSTTTTTTASPATSAPTTAAPTTAPTVEVTTEEAAAVRGDSAVVVEEEVPAVEEDVPLEEEEEEEEQAAIVPDEPAEKPWSPYEAIQRQRESTAEPEAASQVISNSGQPIRIRGKTTFSSSRIPIPPVRPEVGNRQVVLRPAVSIRRPSNPGPRITRPVFAIQEEQNVRLQDDLIPPSAPEFGIRGGVEPKPIFVNNPPAQFLLPVGRRVPEVRPGLQTIPIRIGRPTTEVPSTTTAAPVVEEDLADVFQQETNEFVTDDPTLINDQEFEEEEEEEFLTDEAEGEEIVEEEEEEEIIDEIVPTTAPSVIGVPTTESFLDVVDEQEGGGDQGIVEATTRAPVEQSITTVATPTVIEPAETVVELAAGNSVDDQSKQNGDERDERQVLGVSTATEVSLMYELCYRGRCVRVHE